MIHIKDYIAEHFLNKSFHFKCDCLIPIDTTGLVKDYKIIGNEIVLYVANNNGRVIQIGLNTPSLRIDLIEQ